MNVGVLYSRIRKDEKLLLGELRDRGHEVTKIDVRKEHFNVSKAPAIFDGLDLVLDRCLATSRSLYVTQFVAAYGLPVVNEPATAALCADKVKNSLALAGAGIPTPNTEVAFTKESALEVIEDFGYPCVLKPVIGSWGRLMAKIDSRNAAEAILEHKETLGHYEHKVFYIQEYVEKPGRARRPTASPSPARTSDHWLTHAARGAEVESFDVDDEVADLVERASDAVGGGLLGVDLMETGVTNGGPSGYTVHEVNHTVEFKALNEATDVDVPARIVDWLEHRVADEVGVQA